MDDFSLPFITWQVVDRMLRLLQECERQGTERPTVHLYNLGGVQVTWCTSSGRSIEVDLVNGGAVRYTEDGGEPRDMVPFNSVDLIGKVHEACADASPPRLEAATPP